MTDAASLMQCPSLSRALSRDDPMILCRFPQISSEDQGGWPVYFFPTPKIRGNGKVRRKKQAALISTQYLVCQSSQGTE